jgi:hypothetical protein
MKSNYLTKTLLSGSACVGLLLIFCTAASHAAPNKTDAGAQSGEAGSSIVITRNGSVGSGVFVTVSIDGQRAKTLMQGSRYRGTLSPGKHVISVMPDPNVTGQRENRVEVMAEKGKAYSFSAAHDKAGNLVLLKNS